VAMVVTPEIAVCADSAALAEAAAQAVVEAARAAVATRGRFMIALAGGLTPRETYRRLAESPHREAMPWSQTFVFFGDERCVPADHPDSNYGMARQALLDKVPLPPGQVFPMGGDADDPDRAATDYARTLAQAFSTRRGEMPRFDLVLLGMGLDGHTASLFPGSPVLKEIFRPVVGVHAAAAAVPQRITLTLPVLNAAAQVAFLVAGAEKAKAVKAVLRDGTLLPAALVKPEAGRLRWILDPGAAALIRA
jgi:6-phosphogluconolactonase